ncbi:hypothetical protein CC78DRAFT_134641 [Lojkania enalia]|uniref:Uncharacterized protein n=1 Tax=Lojkania enalia TaxID=147567 RepID=A0A9P4TR26_9PLEO|nr:hypothetical protein CC78DRAFT_134641 [Didymosphaeria enalia]
MKIFVYLYIISGDGNRKEINTQVTQNVYFKPHGECLALSFSQTYAYTHIRQTIASHPLSRDKTHRRNRGRTHDAKSMPTVC